MLIHDDSCMCLALFSASVSSGAPTFQEELQPDAALLTADHGLVDLDGALLGTLQVLGETDGGNGLAALSVAKWSELRFGSFRRNSAAIR